MGNRSAGEDKAEEVWLVICLLEFSRDYVHVRKGKDSVF
jgi:hypothetical protein